MSDFVRLPWRTVMMHVGVGMGAASFWRGAWYVLDDNLFPEQPALSSASSWLIGSAGMMASQGLVAKACLLQKSPTLKRYFPLARFGAIYTLAMSCVFVWRGTWLGWDVAYEYYLKYHKEMSLKEQQKKLQDYEINEDASASYQYGAEPETAVEVERATDPGHATTSGILSHVMAVTILCGTGLFVSILAPPAAASVKRDVTVKATQRVGELLTTRTAKRVPQSTTTSSGLERLHSLMTARSRSAALTHKAVSPMSTRADGSTPQNPHSR